MKPAYVGRFAPSPTGPLHFGSLVAAMGSFLEARCSQGKWLLRIEDIDPPREVGGAAQSIINSLENLGFEWDGPISWQSQHSSRYQHAIAALQQKGLLYACSCSRKDIAENAVTPGVYPGTCRERELTADGNSIRLRVFGDLSFDDAIQGMHRESLANNVGDFVIKRRDGLYAYQLAVVVDDAVQGVTHVVRGADLLDNTCRQLFLQQQLALPTLSYCHLPLALDSGGQKLSKQTHAAPIDNFNPIEILISAWHFLGQRQCREKFAAPNEFWRWATDNWSLQHVPSGSTNVVLKPRPISV